MSRELEDRYGARPLHLIASIASLSIAGYAVLEISERPDPLNFAIWFGLAIVAHDLLAFPLYSLLSLVAGRALLSAGEVGRMALNHMRVPVIISALVLVVWFPLIFRVSDELLESKTGIGADAYLGRWLALTAALFAVSGLILAIRLRKRSRAAEPRPG